MSSSHHQSADLEAKIFQNFRTKPKHHHKPTSSYIEQGGELNSGEFGGGEVERNNNNNNNNHFSNNFGKNFAKIRQHEASDISPRPRRPYQNDSSASRYYNKNSSDVFGPGRYIIDRDNQQQQQQHQPRQRYNNYQQQQQPQQAPSGVVGSSSSSNGNNGGTNNGLVENSSNSKESTNNYYNKQQNQGN